MGSPKVLVWLANHLQVGFHAEYQIRPKFDTKWTFGDLEKGLKQKDQDDITATYPHRRHQTIYWENNLFALTIILIKKKMLTANESWVIQKSLFASVICIIRMKTNIKI